MSDASTARQRRPLRLRGYDYALPGMYFVTLCVQGRRCLFGDVVNGTMEANDAGRMVRSTWDELPSAYPDVMTDASQVMPNHVHGVLVLGHRLHGDQSLSLGDVVRRFKMLTTTRYIDGVSRFGWTRFSGRLWQRDYYDHIIRGDRVLESVRRYIAENPAKWARDPENPVVRPRDHDHV